MSGSIVLGFDTSCYTTSVAAVTLEGDILCSCRRLLSVEQGQRGLRQSDALFLHTRQLPELMEEMAPSIRGMQVAAVCASSRPRDDESSYMPVFLAGDAQARTLSAVLGIPFFHTTHQRGHFRAARVGTRLQDGPALFMHLSGGTTEILSCSADSLQLLGGSGDLHAGQLIDRTGVAMGLHFPAGPEVEKLAMEGWSEHRIPLSMDKEGIVCHLSGAETQVQRWLKFGTLSHEDIAAEVFDFLARTVSRMALMAEKHTGIHQILIAGGVASSSLLRDMVRNRVSRQSDLTVYFGKNELSGDNAVGVALIGREKFLAERQGEHDVGSNS